MAHQRSKLDEILDQKFKEYKNPKPAPKPVAEPTPKQTYVTRAELRASEKEAKRYARKQRNLAWFAGQLNNQQQRYW